MTRHLTLGDHLRAYDLTRDGPLVGLARGIGDRRRSYRVLPRA